MLYSQLGKLPASHTTQGGEAPEIDNKRQPNRTMNRLMNVLAVALTMLVVMPAMAQDKKPLCDVVTKLLQDDKKAFGSYAGKETPQEVFEPKILPAGATMGEVYIDPSWPKRSYENTYAAGYQDHDEMMPAVEEWKKLNAELQGCPQLSSTGSFEEDLFIPEGTSAGGRAMLMWENDDETKIEWLELFVTFKNTGENGQFQVRLNMAKGQVIETE